ncbi:MAG TPA: PAS domain-containing protein [Geobacteraceae bacterium]|nr:PAS domain-containing protein [Geobacteraceae bacterium]
MDKFDRDYYAKRLSVQDTERKPADEASPEERLQHAIEELNTTNEELRVTNEELISTNDELNRVNGELSSVNGELSSVNGELSQLLTSIDSGIIFLDREMRIRKFNPAIASCFKVRERDVGRHIGDIAYSVGTPEELIVDISGVLRWGKSVEKEVTKPGKSLLCRIMPFAGDDGRIDGVVITFTDITRTKEAEFRVGNLNAELEKRIVELDRAGRKLAEETAERIRALEELREKDRLMIQQGRMAAMGEMLGNIAHQWRQPLNALGLTIQHLGLSWELGEMSKDLLDENISKSMEMIRHMSQTIEDFRDFLHAEKEKRPFRIAQVITKACSLTEETFKAHNISLDVGSEGDPTANGFANEFGQVLLNILVNARDAFSNGERETHA